MDILNKDNPVPSLTKKEIEYIKENLLNNGFFENRLYNSIINKLNGVETDKEQPKCSCKKPHYGFKTICICTDCDGIKDDNYWKELHKSSSCHEYDDDNLEC